MSSEAVREVVPAPPDAPSPSTAATRTFLPYLEGIRGFFGLYIALAHAWLRASQLRPALFPQSPFTAHFVAFSHTSIALFIAISGYVLGLPVARRGQRFAGGLRRFFARRALRLLPAYYAALIVALPIAIATGRLYEEELGRRALLASTLLHALMLHNLSNTLIDTIDAPMWSIAVECDIYIVFALLLVPIARRFGFAAMVAFAFGLGLLPTSVGALQHRPIGYRFSESCFWYIGLFALGYAAANFHVDPRPAAVARLRAWPWTAIAGFFALLALATIVLATPYDMTHGTRWPTDVLMGLAIAAQFTANARARALGRTSWFERFFLWRPLLLLGTFSYSFYLLALPVIDLVLSAVRGPFSDAAVGALAAVAVAVALIVSYLFYRVFERPFMTAYRRAGDAANLRAAEPTEIADPVTR